jgi:hypothetical protein
MKLGSAVVVVGFFVFAAFWPAPPLDTAPERFTATALNTNDDRTGRVEIVIERRSTERERQRLLDSMKDDEHSQHLLDTIQTLPRVGYLRGERGRACELHYAYGVKSEDGSERVILATDRRVPFQEAGSPSDRTGGPFTLIELRVMNNGLGQGKLSLVTPTMRDASQRPMTLEDYDIEPLLLLSVRRGLTTR